MVIRHVKGILPTFLYYRIVICAKAELPSGTCKTDGAVNFVWSFPDNAGLLEDKQAKARCYVLKPFKIPGEFQLSI
jgi:hypothetical protein